MSSDRSSRLFRLFQLKEHLKQQGYSPQATRRRIAVAERFFAHLDLRHIAVETVEPSEVGLYLQNELQLFHQHHRRAPRSSTADWRRSHTAGIETLLRLVRGQWPPCTAPSTPREIFQHDLCAQYDKWMSDLPDWPLKPEPTAAPRHSDFSTGWKIVPVRKASSGSRLWMLTPI